MIEWRAVVEDERFSVSDEGQVRGIKGGLLKATIGSGGYLVVCLAGRRVRVHKLVAEAFLGPRPEGLEVCHGPGGPTDNRVVNLRYDTHTENVLDEVRNGYHWQTAKTHCPRGHEYTAENTRISRRSNGSTFRQCAICTNAAIAKWRAKKRAASEKALPLATE